MITQPNISSKKKNIFLIGNFSFRLCQSVMSDFFVENLLMPINSGKGVEIKMNLNV